MSDVPGGPGLPPPPAVSGGPSGGLPPKTLGQILSQAFDIYRANAAKLLTIVAVVVVPLSLIGAIFTGVIFEPEVDVRSGQVVVGVEDLGRSFVGYLFVGAIGGLIAILIAAALQAATARAAALAVIGDPVDVQTSYRYGFRRLGSVILISLLVGVIVAVGFLLLIVPGIIFLVFLSVSIPALIVENRRGTDALGRSWNLVQGEFWHALGVVFVAAILVGIVSGIIGSIGGNEWVIRWIFTAIAQILTAPYAALVSILLYLDLRARKEALSAATLRQELASGIEPSS